MPDSNPLVFVPGLMASKLWQPGRTSWLTTQAAWPPTLYTLTSQLTLLEETYPLHTSDLVEGYYQELLAFITRPAVEGGLGLVAGESFWVFSYDWRQSCRISGRQLHRFILEKLSEANVNRAAQGLAIWEKVNVVNHSMGGLVTRVAITNFAAPIERVAYVASGDYGLAKAFFALHPDTVPGLVDEFVRDFLPGWYWDLLRTFPNVWLLQNWLIRVLGTFQSMYELLPDTFYLDSQHNLIIDQNLGEVHGVEATYFNNPWQLAPPQQVRLRQAMRLKELLGPNLPGDQNLLIYSDSLPTYAYAHYTNRLEQPLRLDKGDGTLLAHSVSRDSRAQRVVLEGSHTQLPNLAATHSALKAFFEKS